MAADHPSFGPQMHACVKSLREKKSGPHLEFINQIQNAIAPIDVAGLGDASRNNWYPALAQDALAAASKLGVKQTEIAGLLRRAGWYDETPHN
jgi:FADH2 O2-dependent halogenase